MASCVGLDFINNWNNNAQHIAVFPSYYNAHGFDAPVIAKIYKPLPSQGKLRP
jgi:hypothetical protein